MLPRKLGVLAAIAVGPVCAQSISPGDFFETKIRPVLANNCFACHNAKLKSGGLDLSVGALLAVGGVVAAALSHHGVLVAVPAAIATTALLGAGNGLVIAKAVLAAGLAGWQLHVQTDAENKGPTNQQHQRVDQAPDPAHCGAHETLLEVSPN